MASILTPGIIATNNYNIIRSYFLGDTPDYNVKNYRNYNIKNLPTLTFQDLQKQMEDRETGNFLITPTYNKYLESFEYSVNFDKPESQILTLNLIDVDGLLEKSLFITPRDGITNLALKTMADSPKSARAAREAGQIIESPHVMYVSFGTSPNLSDWSDPRAFYLYRLQLDITNTGLKKYKCILYPSIDVLFKPRLRFDLDLPNPEREFLFTNESSDVVGKSLIEDNKSYGKILYELLKDYISIACNANEDQIVGIMPDIPDLATSGNETKEDAFVRIFGINKLNLPLSSKGQDWNMTILNFFGAPSQPSPLGAQGENDARISSERQVSKFWTIRAKKFGEKTVHPNLPDWFGPINKISVGLKSIGAVKNLSDHIVVVEENNIKLIRLLQQKGLVGSGNMLRRIIIFGPELMIDHYLYNDPNSGFSNELNKLISSNNSSKNNIHPNLVSGTKEYDVLDKNGKDYYDAYKAYMTKGKSSSDFGEIFSEDELSINNIQNFGLPSQLFSNNQSILKSLDIPIFTNNLKNSNILQISMDNSEQYFAGLNIGIRSNQSKFYKTALQKNIDKFEIRGYSLTSVVDKYADVLFSINSQISPIYEASASYQNSKDRLNFFYSDLRDMMMLLLQMSRARKKDIYTNLTASGDINYFLNQNDIFDTIFPKQIIAPEDVYSNTSLHRYIDTTEDYAILPIGYTVADYRANLRKFQQIFEIVKKTGLFEQFGSLILEHTGDLDYERLFFALSQRQLDQNYIGQTNTEQIPTILKFKNSTNLKEDITNSIEDPKQLEKTATDIVSIQRQQDNLTYANIIFSLFKPELLIHPMGNKTPLKPEGSLTSKNLANTTLKISDGTYATYVNFVPRNFGPNQDSILADIAKYTANNVYKLNIKTLPFFHIDSMRKYILRPCIVLSKKLKAVGVTEGPLDSDTSSSNFDFFTGVYNILGFKHVYNSHDCYSQFYLAKRTTQALLN